MPVIYVRPDEFQLRVEPHPAPDRIAEAPPPQASDREARLEIEALQALLASLPPDQAPGLKAEAAARIEFLSQQLGRTGQAPALSRLQ